MNAAKLRMILAHHKCSAPIYMKGRSIIQPKDKSVLQPKMRLYQDTFLILLENLKTDDIFLISRSGENILQITASGELKEQSPLPVWLRGHIDTIYHEALTNVPSNMPEVAL